MSGSEAALALVAGLAGYQVKQCIIDHGLSLALRRGTQAALLRIEGMLRLKLDAEWDIDPSTGPTALCPTLALFGRTIESAKLVRTGELDLVLSGGARLLLAAGDKYESWTLSLPDNTLIVSGIDGELAVFQGRMGEDPSHQSGQHPHSH